MSTWITQLDASGSGIRLAVKDAIDVAGVPTTAGCAAVADSAAPATADAACVSTARAAGARIVGKTNLHELCFGTSGFNPWFGTPVNPVAPDRVPGGSSSGSAVAVAVDEADVGYGTDTGGSVRIPAACCGLVGLKTTWGRVPTSGVWPLAPSLDTVGPIARDVAGAVAGMTLLEPGFSVSSTERATHIGRLRVPGVDPSLDTAVDRALAEAEADVVDIEVEGIDAAQRAFGVLILTEAWQSNAHLFEVARDRVGEPVRSRLEAARAVSPALIPEAQAARSEWRRELGAVFERVQLLVMPTLMGQPPELGADGVENLLELLWNVSGSPAISLPIRVSGWQMPGSIQLVGPWNGEELLCATATAVEEAVAS